MPGVVDTARRYEKKGGDEGVGMRGWGESQEEHLYKYAKSRV